MLRGGTINVQGDCFWQAQMLLHLSTCDYERGDLQCPGGLSVAGTDIWDEASSHISVPHPSLGTGLAQMAHDPCTDVDYW